MFDLLYLNGEPLVKEPFAKRRELLKKHFKEVEGEWKFANSLDTSTMEEVQVFLDESVKGFCDFFAFLNLYNIIEYIIEKKNFSVFKKQKDTNKIYKNL